MPSQWGSGGPPIVQGWGPAPQLHEASIGNLVGDILRNRLGQQAFQQKNIDDLAKQIQAQRTGQAFAQQAQAAGLLPAGDLSGLGAAGPESAAALATLIQRQQAEQAQSGLRGAMQKWYEQRPTTGTSGVPRYDYNGVLLPGSEYLRRLDQDRATKAYGAMSAQEAEANSTAEALGKKWGIGDQGLKPPGMFASQADKDQFAKDQADFYKANADLARIRTQRTNYEKWYKGISGQQQPGTDADTGDEDQAPPPQTSTNASPGVRPADVQQAIDAQTTLPAGPSAPPPAQAGPTAAPSGAQTGIAPSYEEAQPNQLYRAPDGSVRRRGA